MIFTYEQLYVYGINNLFAFLGGEKIPIYSGHVLLITRPSAFTKLRRVGSCCHRLEHFLACLSLSS
jgi:hypothetical protein